MDQDTLELFERRLAERIEARVRGRLFAFMRRSATSSSPSSASSATTS
jgi:hypothetical protein